jgi:putative transposase
MNRPERLALVDHDDLVLPVVAQCRLLKVARSTLYYQPAPVSADDLAVMRRIDELHLAWPFYGSRRMAAVLRREGWEVNRKRAKRLMRVIGIEAIYQKPNSSKGHPDHKVYPYLLRGLTIDRPNQVWCADITYIPMAKGFVYLVAVGAADAFRHIDPLRGPMDWFSRRVLSWRVRSPWRRIFASRRCGKRLSRMPSQRFSTPTRACSSPAPRSWTNSRAGVFGSAWTARGDIWTIFSSNGCGGA